MVASRHCGCVGRINGCGGSVRAAGVSPTHCAGPRVITRARCEPRFTGSRMKVQAISDMKAPGSADARLVNLFEIDVKTWRKVAASWVRSSAQSAM